MAIAYVGLIASAISGTGGSSVNLTVGAAGVALNDLVIVSVLVGNSVNAPVAPTSTKVTWAASADKVQTIGTDQAYVWSGVVNSALANGDVIGVTLPSGNTEYAVRADEVSGNATSSWLDIAAGAAAAAGVNNLPTVSAITGNANDLLWGCIGLFTETGTITWANSFNNAGSSPLVPAAGDNLWDGSLVVSTTGTETAALTGVASNPEWIAIIACYKAAGGGGGPAFPPGQRRPSDKWNAGRNWAVIR